jgi:hypothetical protein
VRSPSISETQPAGVAPADQRFFVSFGLIISARLVDVQRIRDEIERLGGKIAFQTVSNGPLYVLREYQLERAIHGDVSQLREIHERKKGGNEKK